VEDPEVEAPVLLGGQEPPGFPGLYLTAPGEVDVDPPSEEALGVPGGLAMAQEDQIRHPTDSSGAPAGASATPSIPGPEAVVTH
jgi:hypothetical protein